jgi:hypothetical protein
VSDVNFYGHAVLAESGAGDPDRVLGAMLPDLAAMAGLRLGEVRGDALRAGVELHHRSDSAFHGARGFLELVRDASAWLRDAGIARGPARAAAHVGIELLLDGWLAGLHPPSPTYREALRRGPASLGRISWRGFLAPGRFPAVCARLGAGEIPGRYRDLEYASSRVARALARRPRLALHADQRGLLTEGLRGIAPRLVRAAPGLLGEVAVAMGVPWTAPPRAHDRLQSAPGLEGEPPSRTTTSG